MNDTHDLLRKLNLARGLEPVRDTPENTEDEQSLFAYGWLRGTRDQAAMLDLRFKNGKHHAIGYPWLFQGEFDPSVGITLNFTAFGVTIEGRNLGEMYHLLLRHRVVWIQETDPMRDVEAEEATVVTSLAIHRLPSID